MPALTIREVKELLENQLESSDAKTQRAFDGVVSQIRDIDAKTQRGLDEITKLIDTKVDKLEDKVTSMISAVTTRVSKVEQDLSQIANECSLNKTLALTELYTMDDKKFNLVLFGVPENESEDGNVAQEADINKIDSIFRCITKEEKKPFLLKYRMGKKQNGKARPILVRLECMYDKDHILSHAKVLNNHPQWSSIYVKPDLTKSQREFEKKFEMDKKLEAQNKNLLQKNGQDWEWTTRGRGLQCHLSKAKKGRNHSNL